MFSEKCFITVWLQSYSERYKNKSIKEKEDIPSHPVEKSFVVKYFLLTNTFFRVRIFNVVNKRKKYKQILICVLYII